jgi:hypothetical protein
MKPYEKLQRYWRETDADMGEIETSCPQVEALEKRYGICLPEDFRDYLLHSCPKDEFSNWDDGTSWWSFDRIKNIPEELAHIADFSVGGETKITDEVIARDAAKYIFFADYAIWCMAWAICCDGGPDRGRVAVISGQDRFVADDFAQFVEMYIEDKGPMKRLL